jgi:flagellar assembly factor FliW
MIVQTSRFGAIEVDADRVILFPRGILGFPRQKQYVLIQADAEATFYWLQAVDTPDLAFVVTDPLLFVPDYVVPIRDETRAELGISELAQTQVLVIVNKVNDTLTANLQGPLVIHAANRTAMQVVISEKKYQTRHPILLIKANKPLSKSA